MKAASTGRTRSAFDLAPIVTTAGTAVARYGLVAILLLIGGLKFTHGEALAIQPLIAHSPLLSWVYHAGDVDTISHVLGTSEILIALLIASRALAPLASAVGSALACGTFSTTLSFVLSTPGVWDPGFPALSMTGAFLIKDLVLLGASIFTCGEALAASLRGRELHDVPVGIANEAAAVAHDAS